MPVLALVQFGDGLMRLKPMAFIADCFERVDWPRRYWRLVPPNSRRPQAW
jgi:hypothetical protein